MINLEWLRTFKVIYECDTITEASEKLNMTQPGVSKHLAALEAHIGKKLFNRTTRRLAPTTYGKFLYTQVTNPLQQLEKVAYYAGKRVKKERYALSIGCTIDFFMSELKDIIFDFDMYLVTQFGTETELIEALENNKIQLVVGVKKYNHYAHQFTYLNDEEWELISSNDIALPKDFENEAALTTWLASQTWFAYDNNQDDIKKMWLARFNVSPSIVPRYVLPSYDAIVSVLSATTGVSVVPKPLAKAALEAGNLKVLLKKHSKIKEEVYCAYKLKNKGLKEIDVFMQQLTASTTRAANGK